MELSKRALSVLCAIVELYIRSGEPVASRQVARHSRLGLSSATIRNVMAELEEGGFLTRLHTSAGRAPSDAGFRLYIDNLPRRSAPPPAVRHALADKMAKMRRELIEDIDWVAQLIAQATNEAGVAVRPVGEGPVLEAVSLVLLENHRILGLLVGSDGSVEKRVLELEETDVPRGSSEAVQSDDAPARRGAAQDVGSFWRDWTVARSRAPTRACWGTPILSLASFHQSTKATSRSASPAPKISSFRLTFPKLTGSDRCCRPLRIERASRRSSAGPLPGGRTQVLIGGESETTAQGNLGIVATLFFRDRSRLELWELLGRGEWTISESYLWWSTWGIADADARDVWS